MPSQLNCKFVFTQALNRFTVFRKMFWGPVSNKEQHERTQYLSYCQYKVFSAGKMTEN